ncbi:MAG: M61 family metallopeptidase, partial [Phycisphaerales bacterium]|nr:M61 family metallopeptidase [Phycisphaerales bacterium]
LFLLAVGVVAACASSTPSRAAPRGTLLEPAPRQPVADGKPYPIEYTVSLAAPQTQTVQIAMRIAAVAGDLEIAMPVWRPGRYALIEPAASIRWITAATAGTSNEPGFPLPIEKLDKATWRVSAPADPTDVVITYELYASSLNDRTRHVDDTHAFLSPSTVFLYPVEWRAQPLRVRFEPLPNDWQIATSLEADPAVPNAVTALNYDTLVDSPIEIGLHESFTFTAGGKPHHVVIWMGGQQAAADQFDTNKLSEDFTAIVEEQLKIFGEPPPYERYLYILHVGPGMGGGTEHLSSFVAQAGPAALEVKLDTEGAYQPVDEKAYRGFLSLISHEHFHTWNVKRFRPADLTPYEYRREQYTRLLWLVEGTTSYYDDLVCVRAGVAPVDKYLEMMAGTINGELGRPGGAVQPLTESSFDAWIKFNKPSPDAANSTVSFYSRGSMVSLALDLEIRRRTENTENKSSLDDAMRLLYERFPPPPLSTGYTAADLIEILVELTQTDFSGFFDAHISATEPPDFASLVGVVGLGLVPADKEGEPVSPFLGLTLTDRAGKAVVTGIATDGPGYTSGILIEDEVVALSGQRLSAAGLDARLKKLKPGDTVALTLFRREQLREIEITLAEVPANRRARKLERISEPTDAQRLAYEDWIGHPWPSDE